MSMPILTLSSTSNTSTSLTIPSENTKKTREASFSSYLDGTEETFVLQLKGTHTQSLKSTIEISKVGDKEIDVFDAEKYFKEGINLTPTKDLISPRIKEDEPFEIYNHRVATPSIRSETSWNSRSSLLHTAPKNKPPRKTNKKSTFLATIGCNCSCNDKNSVEIDDPKEKSRTTDNLVRKSQPDYDCVKFDEPELRVSSSNHFSFPVLSPVQKEQQIITNRNSLEKFGSKILEPRKNALILEKFGSKLLEPEKNTLSPEKKLTTWDSISPRRNSISRELDNNSCESDSSSDLFEIESFSKNHPFLSKQTSGPTTHYAPSEVSIDWSVITASAADFSVLSDSETGSDPQKMGMKSRTVPNKEMGRRRLGILPGCKNHKAVRVAGDAHRAMEKDNQPRRSESFTSMTRFHEESKMVVNSDSRNRQKLFDARILTQSGSGSSPCMLYT